MTETISINGFNGEYQDGVLHQYILGNGYRAYNPVLQRFTSPDSMSPFGAGGINPYAYCAGDPINHTDPSGHFIARIMTLIGIIATPTGAKIDVPLTAGIVANTPEVEVSTGVLFDTIETSTTTTVTTTSVTSGSSGGLRGGSREDGGSQWQKRRAERKKLSDPRNGRVTEEGGVSAGSSSPALPERQQLRLEFRTPQEERELLSPEPEKTAFSYEKIKGVKSFLDLSDEFLTDKVLSHMYKRKFGENDISEIHKQQVPDYDHNNRNRQKSKSLRDLRGFPYGSARMLENSFALEQLAHLCALRYW